MATNTMRDAAVIAQWIHACAIAAAHELQIQSDACDGTFAIRNKAGECRGTFSSVGEVVAFLYGYELGTYRKRTS